MLDNYATLLRDGGKYEQAEALYKRSLETWAKCLYPENADAAETLRNYAVLLRKTNRPTEAEPLEARASAMLTKVGAQTKATDRVRATLRKIIVASPCRQYSYSLTPDKSRNRTLGSQTGRTSRSR